MEWLQALQKLVHDNQSCVVVLITEISGSAPRPVGTRMVITSTDIHDTIGGGALELEAISHARALLLSQRSVPAISYRDISLGKDLTQCCGGRVTLQFDCLLAHDFNVHVFGAGHVAQELARILSRIHCKATFHDARSEWLEKLRHCVELPDCVTGSDSQSATQIATAGSGSIHFDKIDVNPYAVVEQCERGAYYVIMSHSHELDFEIVEAVLTRGDAAYCGLIASSSKSSSFKGRLARKGFSKSELQQLTAPLGQHIETGNLPMEVAVAAMADILTARQRHKTRVGESSTHVLG